MSREEKKILRRGAAALLGMALALGNFGNPALGKMACKAAEYSYTVTFYPGNHGSFQGTEAVTVDNSTSGSDYEISAYRSAIRISGLSAGDVVGLDAAMEGAVEMDGDRRYYVKGIRVSGRDNSTVDASVFRVEEDRDYVVAYGIRGNLTSYVVYYEDAQGNTLAPGRTYSGNVGDKPRIAYCYIEGYQPQAYNLTKTLSKNTAENVFTFTYTRIPAGQTGGTGTGGGAGTAGDAGTPGGQIPGENTVPTVPAGTAPGQAGTVQNPGGGQEGNVRNPEGGNIQNPDESQDGDTQNPDEGDNGPREEVDLDEQEAPLGSYEGQNGGNEGFHFPVWASVVIAVAGAAAVVAVLWVMLAARKKAKNRPEEHEQQ